MRWALRGFLAVEVVFLVVVVWMGMVADSPRSAFLHVVAGIYGTILTIFIHCLALFYLNGTARAMRQATKDFPDLHAEYVGLAKSFRRRAYPPATFALLLILVASYLGGWVHTEVIGAFKPRFEMGEQFVRDGAPEGAVPPLAADELARLRELARKEHGSLGELRRAVEASLEFPVREVTLWWIHLLAVGVALAANLWAFYREVNIVDANVMAIRRLNEILSGRG